MKRLLLADGGFVSVSGYLESQGITVTGSDSDAIELERDKTVAKDVISRAGLATSQYIVAKIDQRYDEDSLSLKFPLFIKPSNRGAGLGINEMSVVRNSEELNVGIQSLVDEGFSDILIESFLSGREFSVVILKKEDQERCHIMPLELIAPENKNGDRFLSEGVKNDDTEECIVVKSGDLRDELVNFASKSFVALGARDYGRVDIRLNDKGVPQFLEANLMPSLVDGLGNFPKACMLVGGLSYESVILRIANLALHRKKRKSHAKLGS